MNEGCRREREKEEENKISGKCVAMGRAPAEPII